MKRNVLLLAGATTAALGCGSEASPARPVVSVHTLLVGDRAVPLEIRESVLVHEHAEWIQPGTELQFLVDGTEGAAFTVTAGPALEGGGVEHRVRTKDARLPIALPDDMALDVPYLVRIAPVTGSLQRNGRQISEMRLCVFTEGAILSRSERDLRGPIMSGTRYGAAEVAPGGLLPVQLAVTDRSGVDEVRFGLGATEFEQADPNAPRSWPHVERVLAFDPLRCLFTGELPVPAATFPGVTSHEWQFLFGLAFEGGSGRVADGYAGHPSRGTSRRYFDGLSRSFPIPAVTVGELPVDAEPPSIAAAILTGMAGGFGLSITASDDRGLAGASARYVHQGGEATWSGSLRSELAPGDEIQLQAEFPTFAPSGTYVVGELAVWDWADNRTVLSARDGVYVLPDGSPSGLLVQTVEHEATSPADLEPPSLVSVTIGTAITGENGSTRVPIEVEAVDDVSGISTVIIQLFHEDNGQKHLYLTKVGADSWRTEVPFSPADAQGMWSVRYVRLFDEASRRNIFEASGGFFASETQGATTVAAPTWEHAGAAVEPEELLSLRWERQEGRAILRASVKSGSLAPDQASVVVGVLHRDGERSDIRASLVETRRGSGVWEGDLDLLPSYATLDVHAFFLSFDDGVSASYSDGTGAGGEQLPAYERFFAGERSPSDIPIARLVVP